MAPKGESDSELTAPADLARRRFDTSIRLFENHVLRPYLLRMRGLPSAPRCARFKEWKAFGQLSGDRNEAEFASAMEQGFRSADWKGTLTIDIEVRQAQRNSEYFSAYVIATMYADLGDKDQAFHWLRTTYREHDWWLVSFKTNFLLDPLCSDPWFAELVRKVRLPQ